MSMEIEEPNPIVPFPNTYWVLPGRLLAGEYPGAADEQTAKKRLSALLDVGIRTFVDLTDEDDINEGSKSVQTYCSLLRALMENRRTEVTYMRVPIPDQTVPSVWTVRCILDVVDRSIADENPVYVHCWAGRGRTGTVVGCYLKRHGLASDQEVIAKIVELRQFMPHGRDSSPHMPDQIRLVRNWKSGA